MLLVAACQAGPKTGSVATSPNPTTDNTGLNTVPDCATGESAILTNGLHIGYLGSDPDDPQRCLLQWSDRSHPLYFGFWSSDPKVPMSEEARAAFRVVLTGPVGTDASFSTQRSQLWNQVTITHIANSVVDLAGQRRPALELRVVRYDALGRPEVRAETRYMIDRRTGVLLRSESVTPMADGKVTTTTSWQVGKLDLAG
jgi:hypothetical protein